MLKEFIISIALIRIFPVGRFIITINSTLIIIASITRDGVNSRATVRR